jgi:hypothetical protein
MPYRTHSKIEVPTVIAGNVMWNITVVANCHRESVSKLNAASYVGGWAVPTLAPR